MKDKVIVYPTDTVWGIGGNILSSEVYEQICKIKKTSHSKPLSILFNDLKMLEEYISLEHDFFSNVFLPLSKMQVTFSIDLSLIKKELPYWCHFQSKKIYLRFLPELNISSVCKDLNTPIFSTSLNVSGESPIVSSQNAKVFYEKNVQNGLFLEGDDSKLSGESSSIINIRDKNNIQILRKGKYTQEIISYLKTLKINISDQL